MSEFVRAMAGLVGRLSVRAAGLAFVLASVAACPAQAQTLIDASHRVTAVPGFAGTGLAGTYYNSNVQAGALATFSAPNVCFPDCSSTNFSDGSGGLTAFTNGNATNISFLVPSNQIPTTWSNSRLTLNGYIAINQTGTYGFTLGSDDNSSLSIGGISLLAIPGCCTTVSGSASFSATGLYAVAINFMEFGGGSYLDVTASHGGSCIIGCSNGSGGYTNSGLFYSDADLQGAPAPIPGRGWPSIAILAVFGIASLARRFGRAAL